jgi:hypothetical protein
MWTIGYKGYWIQGYCDREAVKIVSPQLQLIGQRKSLHAAKCAVTLMKKKANP